MGKMLMDRDWKFSGRDEGGSIFRAFNKSGAWLSGAQAKGFDDSSWDVVDLPHDYVIGGVPVPSRKRGEDLSAIPEMDAMDSMLTANGSLERYVAWYRKHFYIGEEAAGKKIFIQFDGVFRNSTVYVNGFYLGSHLSGYTPFLFELTDFLVYGGDNVLAVEVDPRVPEGWWYEGGGIYRHVWLIETPRIYTLPEDTFIRTKVDPEHKSAVICLETTVYNDADADEEISVVYQIKAPDGKSLKTIESREKLPKNSEAVVRTQTELVNVSLWDIQNPALYRLTVTLPGNLKWEIAFGLRTACFDPERGFLLNGVPVKLKGVCMHQDHAGIGVALFDGIQEYRLKKLQEMGCNAYRTSHHPPTPELLDACDRLGILVMDETRLMSSSPEDLGQLRAMVRRDRNHPSVIMYSIGNEEIHIQFKDCAARIARTMKREIQKLDDTRPITEALLLWDTKADRIITDVAAADPVAGMLDVVGINYNASNWESLHRRNSSKGFVVTEARGFRATRGCKRTLAEGCRLSLLDACGTGEEFEAEEEWRTVSENRYIAGSFLWTGFDYHGEPTPFGWPAVSSQFGVFDLCGFPKDAYFYYRSWWREEPVVYISVYPADERGKCHVLCFSNCESVELLVNGHLCDAQRMQKNGHILWRNVVFEAGEIRAVGSRGGAPICSYCFTPAGPPAELIAETEAIYFSSGGRMYGIVNVYARDAKGVFSTQADSEFYIKTENCKIIGVGNGDPMNHAPAKSSLVRLFHGCAQVILETCEPAASLTLEAAGIAPVSVAFDRNTRGKYNAENGDKKG